MGWTQRFQNGLMYLYQSVDMQYFQYFFLECCFQLHCRLLFNTSVYEEI